jgi:hypothetical protein
VRYCFRSGGIQFVCFAHRLFAPGLSCFFALSHSLSDLQYLRVHCRNKPRKLPSKLNTRFVLNNFQTGVREMGNAKKKRTRSVEVVDAVAAPRCPSCVLALTLDSGRHGAIMMTPGKSQRLSFFAPTLATMFCVPLLIFHHAQGEE